MPRDVVSPPVDRPACFRAASLGLSILLVGGVASGLVVRLAPAVADGWLPLVSVVAYGVAGYRIGTAGHPWRAGMLAAALAWGMALPIRLLASTFAYALIIADGVLAAVVGGLAGYIAGRRRTDPDPQHRNRRKSTVSTRNRRKK